MSRKLKVFLPKSTQNSSTSLNSTATTQLNEEYQESVDALAKVKSPAAQVVQDLLCETHEIWDIWLESPEMSIHHNYFGAIPKSGNAKMGKFW